MKHHLVIGGTGMLSGLTRAFLERGHVVSVVARYEKSFSHLHKAASSLPGHLHPLIVDYRQANDLQVHLQLAWEEWGSVGTTVAWIHGTAPETPSLVADFLAKSSPNCRVFHVLASAAGRPDADLTHRRDQWNRPSLSYHPVILGFVREGTSSRWLTDDEISRGVLKAVDANLPNSVVGATEPWQDRP